MNERAASRLMAWILALSILAGVGLFVLYALGGQPQLEGALLFVALGGVGFALILWGKYLFRPEIVTEEREPHASEEEALAAAEEAYEGGEELVARRSFLVRMLVGAFGALGVAAIVPIRSLGPGPGRSLFHTAWRPGMLLVDEAGRPIQAGALALDSVVTVFPQGLTDAVDSVAVLVKVPPDALNLPEGRNDWAPQGNVCYSKLCTHAGCPVGLYLAQYHELQCPCHFSAFDVLNGANPVFGPAPRALPQLPIEIDAQGFLRAKGDFTAPVGPGFWNMGKGS
ncbi:MAG TPA: Rieske 2Fe-2S domain-containing protein [Actinomycetota bacterium]